VPDDIYALAEQLATAAAKRDGVVLVRIARAYVAMYNRLIGQIEAMAIEVGNNQLTTGQLARLTRFNSLMGQIEGELSDFTSYVKTELSVSAQATIAAALNDSRSLVTASLAGSGVNVAFNTLPTETVMKLLGFLQTTSPLYARLAQLAPTNAEALRQLFIDGVGLGWNPRKIAAAMRKQFGANLTDALRMTRTAQNYAYREATRANYMANPNVVTGWYWMAAIHNPNTCIGCIRMHGTFHTVNERLNDHHNGRCAMVPAVKGFASPIKQTGEEWFNALPESEQIAYMGRDYHAAWKQGRFAFGDISREYDNDVYGPMRGVTTLHELLGEG
jgi:hypothetical protein